jgi:hypothetical protein
MGGFFDSVKKEGKLSIRRRAVDLPILYFRDDFFALFFSADEERVRAILPSGSLEPVRMKKGRAFVGVGAFNYIDTTIGPYGEVGVIVPVVHGRKPAPIVPLLRESAYPGFGTLVMHLPVTSLLARDGGRVGWGYTKFTSDMAFRVTPEFLEIDLSEKGRNILRMRVVKKGRVYRSDKALVTYSVKDGNLVKTTIPQTGMFADALLPGGSSMTLGDHPVAGTVRELGLSNKPLFSRYSLLRSAILPRGEIVEKGVRPLEGYRGAEKEGSLTVSYVDVAAAAKRRKR